ncbi:uncharacterized protein CDAR_300631 [Caerostris darwini]|uniref:Ig-like domain-containing protein n=1 Tax=Caerostris darwini TaxID=1538125 RepID=A0AAV4RTZ9_9ARAC|nr:uncharacterized protein CDAR_300631 [Caerostris darwini]
MPKGLKGIPVVLMLAQIGKDIRLPCHYCNQNPGITGRVWRRRTLHGRQKAVSLDMHDDPKKNRVFTTQDHSLVIRRVRPQDGAYYFCYDIEDKSGSAKIDILLDGMPVDFNKEIPKWLKSCQNIRKFKALSRYKCYAEWGPWSKCDACGKVGQRKRIGECRLQKFVKAQMETEGKTVKADFPIVGVGCHSVLLDVIPVAKKILYKIPNLVMIEKCEVSCKGYVTKPSKMKVFMRSSFLRKMAVKIKKKLKSVSPTVSVETKQGREGTYLTLFCPGANIDTRVKWKYNERTLNPDKVREKTGGRITIDATDALHIKELRVTDAGEYICTLYDVEIGIIRLKGEDSSKKEKPSW